MRPVSFPTADGVEIHALAREAGDKGRWALLLHMMPATKESYGPLQEALAARGISSLAIDFRGHGGSTRGPAGALDYRTFTDAEHQAALGDVEAAADWLQKRYAVPGGAIALVGASIGANLALQYAAAHAEVPGVVALSPGLNYHEVTTMGPIKGLTRDRHVFLVGSRDDAESAKGVEKLSEVSLARTDVRLFDTAGHGTRIFEREPAFLEEVADWVAARFP